MVMKRKIITLDRPERFATVPVIPKEKLDAAIEKATNKLALMAERNSQIKLLK